MKPTLRRLIEKTGPDFYPTPGWVTYALLDKEEFDGDIWEPACGNGIMSKELERGLSRVISTDLHDHGYGEPNINFLTTDRRATNIITNPPYNLAEKFVQTGLAKIENKLALLLRLSFLEGCKRQKTIFAKTPPSRLWVFSERPTFYPAGATRGSSGTIAFAWFIWDKNVTGPTELHWFEPVYKARYSQYI